MSMVPANIKTKYTKYKSNSSRYHSWIALTERYANLQMHLVLDKQNPLMIRPDLVHFNFIISLVYK